MPDQSKRVPHSIQELHLETGAPQVQQIQYPYTSIEDPLQDQYRPVHAAPFAAKCQDRTNTAYLQGRARIVPELGEQTLLSQVQYWRQRMVVLDWHFYGARKVPMLLTSTSSGEGQRTSIGRVQHEGCRRRIPAHDKRNTNRLKLPTWGRQSVLRAP